MTHIDTPQQKTRQGHPRIRLLIIWLIILILICGGLWYLFFGRQKMDQTWQAVFLTDGQVYFGKVTSQGAKEVVLREIYYLQNPGSLQQGENSLNKITGELGLIKLGNEIHGPQDEMHINYQHVLFLEKLKENSKIVAAIKNHLSN